MKILNTVLLWLLSQALVWTFYLWVLLPLFPHHFTAPGEEGFLVTILANCLLPLFWVLIWQKQWQTAKTA